MPTHVGLGFSRLDHAHQAGRAAARQALLGLGGRQAAVLLLFATPHLEPRPLLAGIRSADGRALVLGCCAPGIILPGAAAREGVAVLAVSSDELIFSAAHVDDIARGPRAAARRLVDSLDPAPSGFEAPALALLLESSGEAAQPFVAMIQAVGDELGPSCLLVGGGSQDSSRRPPTPIYWGTEPSADSAVLLLVRGGAVGLGAGHGYHPVGPPLVVSGARGNAIDELDGRSAFETYAEQFATDAGLTPETFAKFALDHPLGLPQLGGEYVIRDPYAVSPEGALLCAGAIPERAVVRLMAGTADSLRAAAERAALSARQALGGAEPALALVCSCVSRLNYLGSQAQDEVRAVQSCLGEHVPLIGFFSHGEIASSAEAPALLHNKTVVVGTLARPAIGEEG